MMSDGELQWIEGREEVQRQLIGLRAGLVGLALIWLATTGWLLVRGRAVPSVLTVERLEIVEPNGNLAFVLANSQRPTAATINGQVIMGGQEEERRGLPSIIFFDGKGDEVGGMLFGVRETPDGYNAVRHLSFDGYEQDQTLVLSHSQDPDGSTSGLTVSDRPLGHSILDAQIQLGLEPGATRDELTAAIQALPEEGRDARLRELFGVSRLFLGSDRDGRASLVLRDGQGRPRIIIESPRQGEPSIRLLNEQGATVLRLPESESAAGP